MAVTAPARSSTNAPQAAILLALLALLVFISWRAFGIQPFDGDNLWILAWADHARLSDLPAVSPDVYPEWRPLSYATIWLQYRSASIEHLWSYQLVNMSIWIACGWMVSRIVLELSGSALAALTGGVIVLTSTQLVSSFVLIVERQSSMACFFGLAAWLISIRAWEDEFATRRWLAVSALLAASAFCKEFGLAFTAAIGLFALMERRRPALWAAAAAAGVYGTCRIVFASGAIGPYCEQHGYFFVARNVCFDRLDGLVMSQAAYNVAATGIGSLLPGLFFDDGTVSISARWLLISGVLLAVGVIGWTRGPALNRIGLLIVAFNTVLSVLLYRPRNQAIAVCALGISTGVGLPIVWSKFERVISSRAARAAIMALFLAGLATRVLVMRTLVADRVEMSRHPDACGPDIPDLDRAFMERVWRLYNLPMPEVCR
jgi:hypothetical protein